MNEHSAEKSSTAWFENEMWMLILIKWFIFLIA